MKYHRLGSQALVLLALGLLSGKVLCAEMPTNSGALPRSNSLAALVAEAVAHSPFVVAAQNRWEALARVPSQARTLPDPQIALQEFTVGSPKPSAGYETSDFYYTGIGVSQEIPGPGKLGLQGEIAEKDAQVARHQYEVACREAAEKVREDYFELFYLSRTIRFLAQSQADLRAIEGVATARYRVGEGQEQDVLKTQLQATRMLNQIEHHYREMAQRQAGLKAVLGRDLDSADIVAGDVQPTHLTLTEDQVGQMVNRGSPALMAERAAEERSERALGLARKGYLPDFTIGYGYQKTGPGRRDYYMLTVAAKIPLYFWRKQTPAIEQAAFARSAARQQSRALLVDASAAARDELVALRSSDRVLKLYREGLIPQAQSSLEAALASYRVAKVDFQTLIAAFIDLLTLNEEYYRELADHEIAVARLEQIIGDVK